MDYSIAPKVAAKAQELLNIPEDIYLNWTDTDAQNFVDTYLANIKVVESAVIDAIDSVLGVKETDKLSDDEWEDLAQEAVDLVQDSLKEEIVKPYHDKINQQMNEAYHNIVEFLKNNKIDGVASFESDSRVEYGGSFDIEYNIGTFIFTLDNGRKIIFEGNVDFDGEV